MKLFKGLKKSQDKDFLNIEKFSKEFNLLLNKDQYIAKSDYINIYNNTLETFNIFHKLKEDNILKTWCKKNHVDLVILKKYLKEFIDIEKIVEEHNNEFTSKHLEIDKCYFDNILSAIDKNIKLDDEQRKVCLNDEDYSLVIAGAGAGKTTTLAAKVKYLVEKLHIDPHEILMISFTNKAVNELKDKINKKLNLDIPISTFHSCGRAIVKKDIHLSDSKILTNNFDFIYKFLGSKILEDKDLLSKLIMLFAFYLDLTPDIVDNISKEDYFSLIERSDFSTIKSNVGEYNEAYLDKQTKKKTTIQNETLRSFEEVQIANFLYLNNIDYEYEKDYPFPIPDANKIYTPDFYIKQGDKECYIEHFGITEDFKNDRYTKEELDLYILRMKYKQSFHKIHNTDLISTYSKYNDNRTLLDHLKENLENHGFILNKKSPTEVYEKIKKNQENKYIFKFAKMASEFINLFKTKDYNEKDFEILRRKANNPRNILFLNIMEKVYLAYELYLKENNLVDFEDMINESSRLLREVKEVRDKINFRYILIDEFQDISRARLNLVQEIKNATNAKICVVGDDWQAIYSYAGSEINLFTHFKDLMGYASILKITRTYRNSQELIDIAGNFIQKNDSQLKKHLISNKKIDKPITIYTYDGSWKSKDNKGSDYNKAVLLIKVIKMILKIDPNNTNILLIGRYNFDGYHLVKTGLFSVNQTNSNKIICNELPKVKLTFMTAHATKGLTYDNVIIINAMSGKYGFPSQIEDDPIFNLVRSKDESYDFSEERRLFYVALTRTKNRVFLLSPYQNPSSFVLELINDYGAESINLHELDNHKLSNHPIDVLSKRTKCPVCGYPLQIRKNKNYGLTLYVCTNEPEACGYITNNLKSGKIGIHKCDKCGGIMYVHCRKDKSGYFFGCSNYKSDKTGCNNIEDIYFNKENNEH